MGKMKRFFSLMLVLTIVLGSFGSVFAAEDVKVADEELKRVPTDVVGTEYEKAVARLVAFGVLDGYKDGTYKPEQDVTRAEFAKILVEALGIGNAAKAAAGKVTFKDVPASHWASGYVSTASGYGLLVGFPDGTFKPEQQVSYADALTMLVRALGYQDSFLKGAWPGSHIAKAAEAGITSGVNFADARGFANRGKVAQMVNNTLDCDVVKVETYKDGTVEYTESDVTLLKDKLDISKYEDTRIVADKVVNDGLDKDEVTVRFLKDIDKKETKSVRKDYSEGDEKDFRFRKSINPRQLIGQEVSVYMDDKDVIVYIESENDDKAYFDYVQNVIVDKDDNIEKLDLVRFDKEYRFSKEKDKRDGREAVVYIYDSSNDEYKKLDVKDGVLDKDAVDVQAKVGKFVVKNNEIVYAEIMGSDEAFPWMLVRDNNKGLLKGVNKEDDEFELDLTKDGNYDGVLVFDTLGNVLDVEDIKEGNILYVQKHDYDGDDYAVVVAVQDNIKEGKLTRVKDDRVGIDDKEIKVIKYNDAANKGKKTFDQVFYSVEGFEDIKGWYDSEDQVTWENDMEDADEEDVRAYLDATGKIAFLETEAKGTAGYKYGVVTKAFSDNDRLKVYTYIEGKDGDEITYKVAKEKTVKEAKLVDARGQETKNKRTVIDGDIVKFKLNRDGEIAENELYVVDPENYWVMRSEKDFGKDSIPSQLDKKATETANFSIDDKAVIIDAKGLVYDEAKETWKYDVDDFGVSKWKDMAEDNNNPELKYYVFTKRNKPVDIDAVIFAGKLGADSSSDKEAIYVIKKELKGGDVYVEYASYETGKVEKAEVDRLDGSDASYSKVDKETPYIAKVKSSGKIDLFTEDEDDLTYVKGIVKEKRGNIITVKGDDYKLSTSAIVYEEDKSKSTSNIRVGDAVYFIAENDVNIRVIERLVGSEAKAVEDGKDDGGSGRPGKAGEVGYVNSDGTRIIIGDKTYVVNNDTKIYDAEKGVLALGSKEIGEEKAAIEGKKVVDVKLDGDKLVSLRLQADFSDLDELIEDVEALKEDVYEAANWKDLQDKLVEAKKVAKDELSTQSQVNKAKADLQKAKDNLVSKDNDTTLSELKYGDKKIEPIKKDNEVKLPFGTTEVPEVSAKPSKTSSDVEVKQAKALTGNVLTRTAVVTVTAADGTKAEYTVTFSLEDAEDAKVGAASEEFSKADAKDITATITFNDGKSVTGIKNGSKSLIEDTDYSVEGTTLTIKKEYLAAQDNGTVELTVAFEVGNSATLSIVVSE